MTNDDRHSDRLDALVRHVVHTAPMPEPPAGFVHEMARKVVGHPEDARLEAWLTRAAVAVAAVAAGSFTIPFASVAIARIQEVLGDAPWPLLGAVLAILGGMKLMELVPLPARRAQ